MGFFRIAKTFEVEYGHRLSKHPEKCRFPHGHSLRIEVVARGRELDGNDMVCDYKALKMLVVDVVERLDHAMALNSADPQLPGLAAIGDRVLLFDDADPTTEVLARWLYLQIAERLAADGTVRTPSGATYEIPRGLALERVRVWETSSSWGEYVGLE
ncbi:MAG: 6-carboxytetrahydropterin synthase [Thermoanaerobaculales bacterium]|jgi:6-pyruvoyltetrahydropterin/6-carboxytetrahydropterin synthase|nr:6-carboxytetrahydropterin synthase [Thermoanaerobaculales bacterium]